MKKSGLFVFMCFLSIMLLGQKCDIPLQVLFYNETENIPNTSLNLMKNKLSQIATNNGIVVSNNNTQFAIVTRYDVLDKHIIAGPPAKITYNLNITIYIADITNKKTFSSCSIETDGVGNNKTKALISCIQQLQNNKEMLELIKKGEDKIIAYYNNNYKNIIQKAQTLSKMNKYNEALYYISSIPECCEGYTESLNIAIDIFKKYTNYSCNKYLSQARAVWVSGQNSKNAEIAAKYLIEIYPDAECYNEAMSLYNEMKEKVKADWNFEMKKYDDSISLENNRIDAIKAIGVAYGKGQQPETTNLMWLK